MKKILSLFLVLAILLSLCACSKNEGNSADAGSNSGQPSTENTPELTQTPTDNAENSTPTPTVDIVLPTAQPTPEVDKQVPSETPAPTPEDEEEPSDCEHTYTTATCTMPKICTKCEHIAANSLPHDYKNGVCTVCGRSEMAFNIKEGDWVANTVKAGTNDQGEILSQYILTQNQYVNAMCFSNATSCIVNIGKVIYNEKTYYVDYYYLAFSTVEWEENGDTITIVSRNGQSGLEFVLTKNSETQLTVISSSDQANIPIGTVFTKR